MKRQPAIPNWSRWTGFAASILMLALFLLYPRDVMGNIDPKPGDLCIFVGLFAVPALAAALLCFTRLFWTVVLVGMWYLFWAFAQRSNNSEPPKWSVLVVFAALALLLAPFIGWVSSNRSEESKSSNESKQ